MAESQDETGSYKSMNSEKEPDDSSVSLETSSTSSAATETGSSSVKDPLPGPVVASTVNPFAREKPKFAWAGESSSDAKCILAPSKFSSSSERGIVESKLKSDIPKTSPGLLSPPVLTVSHISSQQFASKSQFKLKPSLLGEAGSTSMADETSEYSGMMSTAENVFARDYKESSPPNATGSPNGSGSAGVSSSSNGTQPKAFMPLGSRVQSNSENHAISPTPSREVDGAMSPSPLPRNSPQQFIFGQNIQSRLLRTEGGSISSANGCQTTGNLFTEAASEITRGSQNGAWGAGKSLAETSRELAEKENSQKRRFQEVEVITGEEKESNVLQMNCKVYIWVQGTWKEKGRGFLRLNDWHEKDEFHSRLVIRTQGTLTVMINTKIWAEMSIERASSKSVRLTASDADGQPKIFLVMGSPKDTDLLYNSLEYRVASARSQHTDSGLSIDSPKRRKTDNTKVAVPNSDT